MRGRTEEKHDEYIYIYSDDFCDDFFRKYGSVFFEKGNLQDAELLNFRNVKNPRAICRRLLVCIRSVYEYNVVKKHAIYSNISNDFTNLCMDDVGVGVFVKGENYGE